MASLSRFVVPSVRLPVSATALWRTAAVLVGLMVFIVARSCAYDLSAVGLYAAYFAAYVVLPGLVTMTVVNRGPVSWTMAIALAIPTGYALEVFSFLGLSALDAKELYRAVPLVWALLALALRLRRGTWPVRNRVTAHHAALAVVLGALMLGTLLAAASQMFAESPLAVGMPTRAIFHDWVYLVSRAGMIKNHWPLEDPSLSGTPLQYHYFMMVHAAAASWSTGVELTLIMLRLSVVPLGAVMTVQAYALGRRVARSPWGGAIAAGLTIVTSEVSFSSGYGDSMFLGLFSRWLFVSPTFFFGMIFCGALLIAIDRAARATRFGPVQYLWFFGLAAAGTGAKGTLLPVVIFALGLWALGRWIRERKFPGRLVVLGVAAGIAFAVVYLPTMSAWRTGDARWNPLHVFQLTEFWKQHVGGWSAALAAMLPAGAARAVATGAAAAVIFAGTCGVGLLALPYLLWRGAPRRDPMAGWMGAFLAATMTMGLLLELNSYGELYVILMMRLPMAILTAAFGLAVFRASATWRASAAAAGWRWTRPWQSLPITGPGRFHLRPILLGTTGAVLLAALALQTNLWWARNRGGFGQWVETPANIAADPYMQQLEEAMLWVRKNTEPDAVLIANACTPENMKKDHWGALDRTLTGVHYYYSALSERRLWFEGPSYILDTSRARLRANLASGFFYRSRPLPAALVSTAPCYVLVDRSVADGAKVASPELNLLFANSRIEIYRLPAAPPVFTGPALVRDNQ